MMHIFGLTSPSIRGTVMSACKTFSHQQEHQLLDEVLEPTPHAQRGIASLAGATLGVMHTASMAVCAIGHGLVSMASPTRI
jgi:hypothetical protein